LFLRDMASRDAPLLAKGGWGDFVERQGFHFTSSVDLWIDPMKKVIKKGTHSAIMARIMSEAF
jgi:hypothetical protein